FHAKVLIFAGVCAPVFAQTTQGGLKFYPPPCNLYRIENTPVLSLRQRLCLWTDRSLTSGEGIMGAAAGAAFAQFTDRSSDLQKGLAGYAERFGTRYAQSTSKGLGEVFAGYLNHEGMRRELGPWKAPPGSSFGKRLGHAFAAPLWNYDDDDATSAKRGKRFAVSRVAGALASGFVGMAWTPDRLNTPGRALRRSASAYGGYWSSSLLSEFGDDILKLFRRL
ncbi:MAG: hypothetical protein ABI822_08775, partial [Bryobacteraceae bacterium]